MLVTNAVFATFDELSLLFCVTTLKLPFTETSFIKVLEPLIFWFDVVFTKFSDDNFNIFLSFSTLVDIAILSPATKVILSRPFAMRLPTDPDVT